MIESPIPILPSTIYKSQSTKPFLQVRIFSVLKIQEYNYKTQALSIKFYSLKFQTQNTVSDKTIYCKLCKKVIMDCEISSSAPGVEDEETNSSDEENCCICPCCKKYMEEGETCEDLCCGAYNFRFGRKNSSNSNTQWQQLTERVSRNRILDSTVLREGRKGGRSIYRKITFPVVTDIVREWWVSADFVVALFGLVFSVIAFAFSETYLAFTTVHFCLGILFSVFATIDAILILRKCATYKSCKMCCMSVCAKENNSGSKHIDHRKDLEALGQSYNNKWGKCRKHSKTVFDAIHVFLTEALTYPLLMFDIFNMITRRVYEGRTTLELISIVLFALSCFSFLFYVYIARVLILIGMIRSIQNECKQYKEKYNDASSGYTALCYHIFLAIYLIGQMLSQVLMIIATGRRIEYDNRHLIYSNQTKSDFVVNDLNSNESIDLENVTNSTTSELSGIQISGCLWYMLIFTYVLPLLGFFLFFFLTYYWLQEFPLGLYVVNLFKMAIHHGKDAVMKKDKSENELSQEFKYSLEQGYSKMRKKSCIIKFCYPFTAPTIIVLCFIYMGIYSLYEVCAVDTLYHINNGTIDGSIPQYISKVQQGNFWVLYHLVGGIVIVIANFYAFVVAAVWSIIFVIAMFIVAVLVFVGVFCCACYLAFRTQCKESKN